MRRWIGYVLRWLLLFAFFFGLRYALGPRDEAEIVATMAFQAALYATLLPLLPAIAKRLRGRRHQGSGDHVAASWRPYQQGRPARWRGCWMHRSGAVVVVVPNLGSGGTRVAPTDVREIRERPLTRRETWQLFGSALVLEVELAEGRLDLAVDPDDVADVRHWLGAA